MTWRAHGHDGWGRYTVEVVRAARELGVEPVLVSADPSVDVALAGIEHHAVVPPLFHARLQTPRSLLHAPRLRRVLASCDVVHCTVEPYAPLTALAHPRRMPYVQSAHGTWAIRPLESVRQRAFFAPAFRAADALVFQSRFTRDRMARLIRLPRHLVAPGGVRAADFERSAVDTPSMDGTVVLSVGAVKERKGQHVALEAVGLARSSIPDLRYVVIGSDAESPAYAARLRRRAAEIGMADRFHLLGSVPFDELVAWYRRAGVLLLLPVSVDGGFEGLGLVYLEAAAAGVPTIGTLESGASEAIVNGETGLLVRPDDPRAAAEGLTRILRDSSLRNRMGQAARERARRLSWSALASRLVALYEELLHVRRSTSP